MARANRHHIPGCVWHITHRCHKQEFLLKFSKDRRRWIHWLFEAKKRFGLSVLNYVVTSNHIHLLVVDNGKDLIPKSIQLIAGRTGQEYNQRKSRKGAFWEDRYHAVAVETNEHLAKCLVYIDLNMVRAGVVNHPSEWRDSGYNEIQNPVKRYSIIDQKSLLSKYGAKEPLQFRYDHKHWVEEAVNNGKAIKEPSWSESIAVGSKRFVEEIKEKLGFKAMGRKVVKNKENYTLREPRVHYNTLFTPKMEVLSLKNTYFWDGSADITDG